jgi:hypothetical protein
MPLARLRCSRKLRRTATNRSAAKRRGSACHVTVPLRDNNRSELALSHCPAFQLGPCTAKGDDEPSPWGLSVSHREFRVAKHLLRTQKERRSAVLRGSVVLLLPGNLSAKRQTDTARNQSGHVIDANVAWQFEPADHRPADIQ